MFVIAAQLIGGVSSHCQESSTASSHHRMRRATGIAVEIDDQRYTSDAYIKAGPSIAFANCTLLCSCMVSVWCYTYCIYDSAKSIVFYVFYHVPA